MSYAYTLHHAALLAEETWRMPAPYALPVGEALRIMPGGIGSVEVREGQQK